MDLLEFFKANPGTQTELAQKVKVTPSYLSMIAHGHRVPSPDIALDIFIELGGRVSLQSINASLAKKFRRLCQAGLIQYALVNGE